MARIVVVSFRLGGNDGVAIESAKWIAAIETLGHNVRTVAGEGVADVILPSLAIDATTSTSIQALSESLSDADLVIVENLASLPLNLDARDGHAIAVPRQPDDFEGRRRRAVVRFGAARSASDRQPSKLKTINRQLNHASAVKRCKFRKTPCPRARSN